MTRARAAPAGDRPAHPAGGAAGRLATPEALLGPDGRALLATLPDGPLGPAEELRLGAKLRRRWPAELVAAALTLHELRLAARAKFTRAAEMWFTRDGLEQASSERMAALHARRFAGLGRLADLCTGIGGDLIALAAGREVLAVDVDPVHLRMAAENAAVHGAGAGVAAALADARSVDLGGVDGAFVDPARRAGGRRLAAPDGMPPLGWCLGLADRVGAVGIKAAPGLPLEHVPPGWEAEFVAEGRELKEAALWSAALATAPRRATMLPGGDSLVAVPGEPVAVAPPGGWLLDPSPAVTRAGLVEDLARTVGGWKLDPMVGFVSVEEAVATPFARTLRIVASLPWQLKRLRAELRERGVGAVEIRKRGSAVDVEELRRRLRLEGDAAAVVVLTRVAGQPWALVCADGAGIAPSP
jgi:THUMP domain-like/RNA cap guanine-N2 methyltransferase